MYIIEKYIRVGEYDTQVYFVYNNNVELCVCKADAKRFDCYSSARSLLESNRKILGEFNITEIND